MEPNQSGNPVFSVVQTDVIYFGWDLETYFTNAFAMSAPENPPREATFVPFWSELVIQNQFGMPSTWRTGP